MKTTKYKHVFENGFTGTLVVDRTGGAVRTDPPLPWPEELLPEFRRWRLGIYKDVARRIGKWIVVEGPGAERQGECCIVGPNGEFESRTR